MQEVTIKELWSMVKKRLWLILAFCILVTVAAGAYYWRQPDEYTAEAKLYVLLGYINNMGQLVYDMSTGSQFTADFPQLVKTTTVMERSTQRLGISEEEFSQADIQISSDANTHLLYLSATSLDPEFSMQVANAVSQEFKEYIQELIAKPDAMAAANETAPVTIPGAVNIADEATLPTSSSGPNRGRNTMLAMIVSLMLGVGVSIAIELLNTTLRSAQEAENALSLPVLASIQTYKKELQRFMQRRQKGDALFDAVSEATRENVKSLATNLQFTLANHPPRCLTVTSSISGEGKSSLLLLLAQALAEMGKTVLLVDMDMRNPSIGKYLGARGRNDLLDYLMETARLEEVICKTQNPSVFFVDSRHRLAAAHQMAAYERFDLFLSGVQQMFDVVLFDTPPLGLFVDAAVLTNKADGALLVVGCGMTDRALVRDMAGQLHKANANILGAVLNFVDERRSRKYYYGKYYSRYAKEERAQSRKDQSAVQKKTAEEV